MTLSAPRVQTSERVSPLAMYMGERTVKSGTTVYEGQGCALNSSGQIVLPNASDAVATYGIAPKTVIGDGTLTMAPKRGIFRMANSGTNVLAIASGHSMAPCFWEDDGVTVGSLDTAGILAGFVFDISSLGVDVVIDPFGAQAAAAKDAKKYVSLLVADLVSADASVYSINAPIDGKITKISATLQGHILVGGNATITSAIGSTGITGGVVTLLLSGTALGNVYSATPSALNAVTAGQALNFTVGGTQTNAAAQAVLEIEFTPN